MHIKTAGRVEEKTLLIYQDNNYTITKTVYSDILTEAQLQCFDEQYIISKVISHKEYEIITPAFEHIYCDYIRCLFCMKQLEIPENVCTLFLEICNDKKEEK